MTVSRRVLAKLDAARDALSHAQPGATTEEVLEAALDLLLEKAARRRAAMVEKPSAAAARKRAPHTATATQKPGPRPSPDPSASPTAPNPRHVPAAVRRAVWARDGERCTWRLESGALCGSTHRLELDHVTPVALGGASTVGNLRVLCDLHNRLAARRALGDACVDRYARRSSGWQRGPM